MLRSCVWFLLVVLTAQLLELPFSSATTANTDIPMEFPKSNETVNFLNNSTIRKNLADHNNNNNKGVTVPPTTPTIPDVVQNDTEVADLLQNDDAAISRRNGTITELADSDNLVATTINVTNPSNNDLKSDEKNDTEWIENGDDTEDVLMLAKKEFLNQDDPIVRGQLAAILAGVFLVIAIVAYAALLSWRRYLEARYGSREMLVEEDDMQDPEDMKHFTI